MRRKRTNCAGLRVRGDRKRDCDQQETCAQPRQSQRSYGWIDTASQSFASKVDFGDKEFLLNSRDFVDRSACPEKQRRSTKSHEPTRIQNTSTRARCDFRGKAVLSFVNHVAWDVLASERGKTNPLRKRTRPARKCAILEPEPRLEFNHTTGETLGRNSEARVVR